MAVVAKSGYLNFRTRRAIGLSWSDYFDDTEADTDFYGSLKNGGHLFGTSVGGDVVIRGNAVEEEITHSAAREEGLISVALERVADRIGEFAGVHGEIMRL